MVEQNFCIDLAHNLFSKISQNIKHRPEINAPAISAYWSKEFLEHHNLNSYPLDADNIYIELDYYSYLNLDEFRQISYKSGTPIYIVDLITDSTDVKSGMVIDDWFDENEEFKGSMQELWDSGLADIWHREGKLLTKKNTYNYSHYWNFEQFIYQLRVYDGSGKPMLVILLGTYSDYN